MMIDLSNINPDLKSFDMPEEQIFKAEPASPPSAPISEATPVPEPTSNIATLKVNGPLIERIQRVLVENFSNEDQIEVYIGLKFLTHITEKEFDIQGVEFN